MGVIIVYCNLYKPKNMFVMKHRLLFLLVVLISSLNTWSQNFKFMGIEMNCPIDSFVLKLQSKNFVLSDSIANINNHTEKWMKGHFAGNDVLLHVESTPHTDIVYMVSVVKIFDYDEDERAEALWHFYTENIEKNYLVNRKEEKGQYDVYYYVDDIGVIRALMKYSEKEKLYYVMLFYVDIKNSDLGKYEDGLDI